jgi:hypothetical protein
MIDGTRKAYKFSEDIGKTERYTVRGFSPGLSPALARTTYVKGRYSIRFAMSSGFNTWQTTSRSSTYLPTVAAS